MNKGLNRTAEEAMIEHYNSIQKLIEKLNNKIHDFPAPDCGNEINWTHAAEMERIKLALAEIANDR